MDESLLKLSPYFSPTPCQQCRWRKVTVIRIIRNDNKRKRRWKPRTVCKSTKQLYGSGGRSLNTMCKQRVGFRLAVTEGKANLTTGTIGLIALSSARRSHLVIVVNMPSLPALSPHTQQQWTGDGDLWGSAQSASHLASGTTKSVTAAVARLMRSQWQRPWPGWGLFAAFLSPSYSLNANRFLPKQKQTK